MRGRAVTCLLYTSRDDLSETDIFHDGANGMERCPGSSGENITGDTKGEHI